jgi:hypothetical protein
MLPLDPDLETTIAIMDKASPPAPDAPPLTGAARTT